MATYYYRPITIDHTKVAANQTNFPVLISGTFPELKYTGFGGHVTFNDGRDIAVYADSDLSILLDFEIEKYVPSTGELELWVRIPTLSSSLDTSIYLAYGNGSLFGLKAAPAALWSNSNYAAVWHLSQGQTFGNAYDDSTGASHPGAGSGGSITSVAGQIGDAVSIPAFNSINVNDSSDLRQDTATISLWHKPTSTSTVPVISKLAGTASYYLQRDSSGLYAFSYGCSYTVSSAPVVVGTWSHIVLTSDSTTVRLYANGVLVASAPHTSSVTGATGVFTMQAGVLDEVRYSGTAKSATWIATEYANQNDPTSFAIVGTELSVGPQTITATGVPSPRAFGSFTFSPNIAFAVTGRPSSIAFGTATIVPEAVAQIITATGVPSPRAFGSATIGGNVVLTPGGVPSSQAFGSAALNTNRIIPAIGRASTAQVGLASITAGNATITPDGVPSSAATGTATFSANAVITATGATSTQAVGNVTLVGGPISIDATGAPSTVAFGAFGWSSDSRQTILAHGVPSSRAFGNATLATGNTTLQATGAASTQAFGDFTFSFTPVVIFATGAASTRAFGKFTLSQLQQVPRLTWSNPAPIDLGTPLGPKQLDARCPDTTGTFVYNPPTGTVLPQGLQRLAVAFTLDSGLWTTASAEVLIQVGEAVTAPVKVFPVNLRYRRQDSAGDYVLTGTGNDYHRNTPAAVAACVRSRLLMFQGEWFLDTTVGVPWSTEILGVGRRAYDTIIREAITSTPGVDQLLSYTSTVSADRTLTVNATISTIYGGEISLSLPIAPSTSAPANLATPAPAAPPPPALTLRVRKQDSNGDYVLTGRTSDYLVNSPAAVAQIVMTRLRLWRGEYHLDVTQGTPWADSVLGENQHDYSAALKDRILSTPGVLAITSWSANVDPATRALSISAGLETTYGSTTLTASV